MHRPSAARITFATACHASAPGPGLHPRAGVGAGGSTGLDIDSAARPDWARSWYAPLADVGAQVWQCWTSAGSAAIALELARAQPAAGRHGCPVRFVPSQALPAGVAYEQFICTQGQVPTRDNAHDLFNGLVWLHWPRAKRAMNRLQAGEIARRGVGATRGPVRDALTLFDEDGALLAAPDALWQALRGHRWAELFGPLRPLWRQARLWVLGHAALEKLLTPYKSITVHVLRAPPRLADVAAADAWLADWLAPERLVPKPFAPLPLLGVPGWWPANESAGFYDDAAVFRPPRPHRPAAG